MPCSVRTQERDRRVTTEQILTELSVHWQRKKRCVIDRGMGNKAEDTLQCHKISVHSC